MSTHTKALAYDTLSKYFSMYKCPDSYLHSLSSVFSIYFLKNDGFGKTDTRRHLTKESKNQIKQISKYIRWMIDDKKHHGPQATQYARKILRGIINKRMTAKQILTSIKEFLNLRQKHINEKFLHNMIWDEHIVPGRNSRFIAYRITSLFDMNRSGAIFENCLDKQDRNGDYAKDFLEGNIMLYEVYDNGMPAYIFTIDLKEKITLEIKGVNNSIPFKYARNIKSLLKKLRIKASGDDAENLGII